MNTIKSLVCIVIIFCISTGVYADEKRYGPTQTKDTLWKIASQYKTSDTTMYQIMLAFYSRNPNAFYEGNMNRMKQGVYLKIPTVSEINSVDFKTATIIIDKKIDEYDVFFKKFTAKPIFKKETKKQQITQDNLISKITPSTVNNKNKTKPIINNIVDQEKIVEIKEELKQEVKEELARAVDPSTLFNFGEPLKFRYSYDVSISYDDNMRLAQEEADIRSDVISNLILKVGTSIKASRLSRFRLGASLEAENYSTFTDLNNISYNIHGSFAFSTNTSFSAPLYIIKLSIGGIESDSDMRSSNVHKIGFNVNKRVSSNIHVTGGIQFKQRESESLVFDTNQKILFINTDYSIDRKSILYGTYHYITGHAVSSSTPSLNIINAAEEIEPDDAFDGISLNQFAYKLDSETHVITFGFNKRLSRNLSYDLSYRYVSSEAVKNSDIQYDRSIIRAGILGRF